jgi:RNA polymerase sigma-70 factor (ECF subfamily)
MPLTEPAPADLALARRILRGDDAAFRRLFDAYFPRLYRFAMARLRGDHDAASEVVQQTFCKAIEKLDSYRGEAALYTWFCQICRNTLIDYCRATNRNARAIASIEDEPDVRAIIETFAAPAVTRPDVAAWQDDVRRLVEAIVDRLPDRYGDILEWKYADGLRVAEIAMRLGVSEKAAESLLTRAREAFREALPRSPEARTRCSRRASLAWNRRL